MIAPIKFSNFAAAKFWQDNGITEVYSKSWLDFVGYIINSDFRKSVKVKDWLSELVKYPSKELQDIADLIPTNPFPDIQVKEIQNWIYKNIKYKIDKDIWQMSEHWNTPDETLKSMQGDCEDGAILMYTLCRLKGISSDRLLLMAGNVLLNNFASTGGHCWLAYRPFNYPLNFIFLDWCYYSDLKPIHEVCEMQLYNVIGKSIQSQNKTSYLYIWFAFNEIYSFYNLNDKFGGTK